MKFITFTVLMTLLFYITACSSSKPVEVSKKQDAPKNSSVVKYDKDYARILAGSCLVCHKDDGSKSSIPPIHGIDKEALFTILKYFKSAEYQSGTMGNIARTFSDEELELLSYYFADQ